jgi:hypothetical protein
MRVRRLATVSATVAALGAALVALPAAPVFAADPVGKIQQMGPAQYTIYIVKDLGGGAYWNVTTSAMYVVDTASAALVTTATLGKELTAQSTDDGRTLLLLVNGAVLVPVQNAL